MEHRSAIGGCVNTALIESAIAEGRKWRNTVLRGDCSLSYAFDSSGVGYPYMTAAESTAAFAAFKKGARLAGHFG